MPHLSEKVALTKGLLRISVVKEFTDDAVYFALKNKYRRAATRAKIINLFWKIPLNEVFL